jgi:positive regulator of sigma E activity
MTIGENEAQVEIPNTLHARVGDAVQVELHEKGLLRASLLAYVLPLCALLLGIALGIQISNVAGMLIGLGSAALVYVLLHLLEPRFARMETLRPRMISIESSQETVGGKEDVQ